MALDYKELLKQGVEIDKELFPQTPKVPTGGSQIPTNSGTVDGGVISGVPWTQSAGSQKLTARSIKDFRASFITDLGKPSYFDVLLFVPDLFLASNYGPGLPTTEKLAMRCETAEFPGRTIATQDLKIYGPTEKLPYQTTYNDITLTFICSSSMIEKNLFDLWMDYINPPETWNFRFKNNYATRIVINQYNQTRQLTHQVTLIDAFPVSVNQLDLNWNDDTYHKLSVTFAYTYWEHSSEYASEGQYVPINPNSPFYIANLKKIIETAALANSAVKNAGKANPYGMLAAAGAASSIFGGDISLSKLLGGQNTQNFEQNRNYTVPIANRDVDTMDEDL